MLSGWAQSGVLQAQELGLILRSLQAQYDAPITRGEFARCWLLWLKAVPGAGSAHHNLCPTPAFPL